MSLAGPSENAQLMQAAIHPPHPNSSQELLFSLAQNILSFVKTFGEQSPITQRGKEGLGLLEHRFL